MKLEQHKCTPLISLRTFNKIWIQYEPAWGKFDGGWSLNIDPGGEDKEVSEWIEYCPFCGVKLDKNKK
jgi:hypothetical protein